MYLDFKNLKTRSKKGTQWKAKSKVRMTFFEVKMEQDRCRYCNYKLNCKKQKK